MAPRKVKNVVARLVIGKKLPCAFCYREIDDELLYGKLYAIGDIQCHYYCVLLASCLIQKGKDDQGLFGFLYEDILAEVERCKKHKCSYCGQVGASLGCSISQCRKQFHLACGRDKNSVSLFYGNYKSYCQNHAPRQKIPDLIMAKAKMRKSKDNKNKKLKNCNFRDLKELSLNNNSDSETDTQSVCVICYENVDGYPTINTFWPPCCARDAWFHRTCLQRMALSAGMHYLKCPLCNDKDNFYDAVLSQGYFVPDRDAAWELEQNAFAEIYERPVTCSATECLCPMGRNHDDDNGSWSISICLLCGSTGQHIGCIYEQNNSHIYVCVVCKPAAPQDLDSLANSIEAVISQEERSNNVITQPRPIMPCRMSIRRTKKNCLQMPSCSRIQYEDNIVKTECVNNTTSSREILNLKTPKKLNKDIESPKISRNLIKLQSPMKIKYISPTKILEDGIKNKFGKKITINEQIIDELRKKFKKPQPFSIKKQIVNDILNGFFDNLLLEPKQKDPINLWCSPRKMNENDDVIEVLQKPTIIDLSTNEDENISYNLKLNNNTNNSTVYDNLTLSNNSTLTDNNITINNNSISPNNLTTPNNITTPNNLTTPDNITTPNNITTPIINNEKHEILYPIINTPKKLNMVDIVNNTSLEISAKDEIVNIDVIKIENEQKKPFLKRNLRNKCAFKFNSGDKEMLDVKNVDIDIERFKNQYLYEVSGKCSKENNKKSRKRKLDEKIVLNHDNEKQKSKISIKNIKVKIKWRQKQLKLKINDVSTKKMNSQYKQYVLKYSPKKMEDNNKVIIKPDVGITPKKRKYNRNVKKSPDNLVQTSIQSFFKVKNDNQ